MDSRPSEGPGNVLKSAQVCRNNPPLLLHLIMYFQELRFPVVSPFSPGQVMRFGLLAWMVAQEGVKKLVLSARG